jgi:hypothetical protein
MIDPDGETTTHVGVGVINEGTAVMAPREPADVRGMPDDPRTGKPGLFRIFAEAGWPLKKEMLRVLLEAGVRWTEEVSEALDIPKEEVLRRLLNGHPSIVDEDGRLRGVAREIQELIPRTQAFPLPGQKINSRAWGCDIQLVRLFLAAPRRRPGNPLYGPGYVAPPARLLLVLVKEEFVLRHGQRRGPDGVPISALGVLLQVTPAQVEAMVERLVKRELVERVIGGDDPSNPDPRVRLTTQGVRRARSLAGSRDEDEETGD